MVRILSREGLVSLIWASAALATPLIAEPIISHDLAVRHSSLEVRQNASDCPSSYQSKNGLNFTIYCNKNNPFNDALDPFTADTLNDCLEHCSRFWGDEEGCFGVVWNSAHQCWIRNSTTSAKSIVDEEGTYSALIQAGAMKGYNTDCPAEDLSTKTLGDIGYTVHCNKDIGGNDAEWRGYPSQNGAPFMGFYHATSLENCLQYCINEHPLCRAVAYNPGPQMGYANCWPKAGFADTLSAPGPGRGIMHAATITSLDQIDTSCPKDSAYIAPGNKHFDVVCGKVNSGTNITSVHERNMTACMDACAASNQNCVGVVFDASLGQGYNNCYLKNTTSVSSDQDQASYALLNKTAVSPSSTPSPSGTGNSDSSDNSSSKAWIAGPVIGAIAAIAIIGFALFWWRRRKSKAAAAAAYANGKEGFSAPGYTPYEQNPSAGGYQHAQQPTSHPSELGGEATSEMATTEYYPAAAKYAHTADAGAVPMKHTAPAVAPQELPS